MAFPVRLHRNGMRIEMIEGKGYTNQGGREYNEDKGIFSIRKGRCYAVIADGLGGHGGGDRASSVAVETIKGCIQAWLKGKTFTEEDMEEWFERVNQNVMSMQTADCQMRTTLALLCIDERERTARLAHLGDSRIYHFENGKYVSCTFDHSVSRMAVLAGEIEIQDVRFHVDRNKLLKVIGKAEGVKAETKVISLSRQLDHAFLLCTDGFWEYVMEEEMEQELQLADSPEEWLRSMRRYLKERAKEENDNNSAIAIWVHKEG